MNPATHLKECSTSLTTRASQKYPRRVLKSGGSFYNHPSKESFLHFKKPLFESDHVRSRVQITDRLDVQGFRVEGLRVWCLFCSEGLGVYGALGLRDKGPDYGFVSTSNSR